MTAPVSSTVPSQNKTNLEKGFELARIGNAYFESKNHDVAWYYLTEASRLNPNESSFYLIKGLISHTEGYIYSAFDNYTRGISLSSRIYDSNAIKSDCYFNISIIYAKCRDEDEGNNNIIESARFGNERAQQICRELSLNY